jgi:hypothetical protein
VKSLKGYLADWTDIDVAQYWLGCTLGMFEADESLQVFRHLKGVFWTENSIGNLLHEMLETLISNNLLEFDETSSKVRWIPK